MPNILIAEDEALIALTIEFALEEEGHHLVMCSNGLKACEAITRFSPDLVITDYMMPLMDGAELIRKFRGLPDTKRVPIILMTAMREDALPQPKPDFDLFLAKPFFDRQLIDAVNRALAIRR
jgi:CheY-like chemotaxis protein